MIFIWNQHFLGLVHIYIFTSVWLAYISFSAAIIYLITEHIQLTMYNFILERFLIPLNVFNLGSFSVKMLSRKTLKSLTQIVWNQQ